MRTTDRATVFKRDYKLEAKAFRLSLHTDDAAVSKLARKPALINTPMVKAHFRHTLFFDATEEQRGGKAWNRSALGSPK